MDEAQFAELDNVAALFAGFRRPWFVAGGWALDLYLDRVTRLHEDVDLAIFREDQLEMQKYLSSWQLFKATPDRPGVLQPWVEGEWLALPVHEIHAPREDEEPQALEVLLNEQSGELWQFRRNLDIMRPLALATMRTSAGLPFLSPEIVLLYKSRSVYDENQQDHHAAKSLADFGNIVPHLDVERRKWLRQAIESCYPSHQWLQRL